MFKADAHPLPISLPGPSPAQCERQVLESRRLFQRTLASWASDLLILRSRGMRMPVWNAPTQRKAA